MRLRWGCGCGGSGVYSVGVEEVVAAFVAIIKALPTIIQRSARL